MHVERCLRQGKLLRHFIKADSIFPIIITMFYRKKKKEAKLQLKLYTVYLQPTVSRTMESSAWKINPYQNDVNVVCHTWLFVAADVYHRFA